MAAKFRPAVSSRPVLGRPDQELRGIDGGVDDLGPQEEPTGRIGEFQDAAELGPDRVTENRGPLRVLGATGRQQPSNQPGRVTSSVISRWPSTEEWKSERRRRFSRCGASQVGATTQPSRRPGPRVLVKVPTRTTWSDSAEKSRSGVTVETVFAVGVVGDDDESVLLGEFHQAVPRGGRQHSAGGIVEVGHGVEHLDPLAGPQPPGQRIDVESVPIDRNRQHPGGMQFGDANGVREDRVVDGDGIAGFQQCGEGERNPVQATVGDQNAVGGDALPVARSTRAVRECPNAVRSPGPPGRRPDRSAVRRRRARSRRAAAPMPRVRR